jgi:hypothetical protein
LKKYFSLSDKIVYAFYSFELIFAFPSIFSAKKYEENHFKAQRYLILYPDSSLGFDLEKSKMTESDHSRVFQERLFLSVFYRPHFLDLDLKLPHE